MGRWPQHINSTRLLLSDTSIELCVCYQSLSAKVVQHCCSRYTVQYETSAQIAATHMDLGHTLRPRI